MRRWHLQQGRSVIPKATQPQPSAENIDVFDVEPHRGTRGDRRPRHRPACPEPESITLENYGRPILEDELKCAILHCCATFRVGALGPIEVPHGSPGRGFANSREGAAPNHACLHRGVVAHGRTDRGIAGADPEPCGPRRRAAERAAMAIGARRR
jgi:hypothetical protein